MDHFSRISTLHLVPDWLNRLLEESKIEAKEQKKYRVRLIRGTSRRILWNICLQLGMKNHGLPGLACRLLERYLSSAIHHNYGALNQEAFKEYKDSLLSKIPLLIAASCMLAAKMNSSRAYVHSRIIRAKYLCLGESLTVDEINAAEFEVFSTLGFRIPLWTSVDTALLLAPEAGMPSASLDVVADTVNLAEFKRDLIEKKVLHFINVSPPANSATCLLTLHLTAGAVLAAGRVIHFSDPHLVTRLSHLTRAPIPYINFIGDLICTIIFGDGNNSRKRVCHRKTLF